MTLAEQLWDFWKRHKKHWSPYFEEAGLDLRHASKNNLPLLLSREITVNRGLKGLEEFSRDGNRGIEPGDPARSFFYHVFASPNVQPQGIDDADYPEMEDLGMIENCIYAAAVPSLADLQKRAAGKPLAIVVFAYEYVPAIDTVHCHHADLCFSRTGISRVGNAPPHYMRKARGFFPHSGVQEKVHVIPARFGAFVAFQTEGRKETIGPMRFGDGDEKLGFWVPLHKLFNGPECIRGLDLQVKISAHHVNEKIKRVHVALGQLGIQTQYTKSELEGHPFRISANLANYDNKRGLLIPVAHNPMVEPAKINKNRHVGFPVPRDHRLYEASLWFVDDHDARHCPEFVHVKHEIETDGARETIVYLPERKGLDLIKYIQNGGYKAANFVDYTADGWIDVDCVALSLEVPKRLTAYSVLAQPDFFPLVKQQDLIEWWENSAPKEIKDCIWPDVDVIPEPMSGSRLPANFTLEGARFDSTDKTMTAIIGLDRYPGPQGPILPDLPKRESTLSYRATNLFEPGWDSSQDFDQDAKSPMGTLHLANYGLGSPYPEDTLICAASGSFWPGAVPDVTRFFAPNQYPSVTPVPDSQAGWDGTPLPTKLGSGIYKYQTFAYADYVAALFKNTLPYERFAEVTLEDYITRTLVTARVFQTLGVSTPEGRALYAIVGFESATAAALNTLMAKTGIAMDRKSTYHITLAKVAGQGKPQPKNPKKTAIKLGKLMFFYANPATVAHEDQKNLGNWHVQQF